MTSLQKFCILVFGMKQMFKSEGSTWDGGNTPVGALSTYG